jgi:LPXTG-motif cell wall-anchored protein
MGAEGVPATGGYAVAAYVVAAVILGGYAWILYRRGKKG